MFALFEAGFQVIRPFTTPRFGCASRGANIVQPLRGCALLTWANRAQSLRGTY